MAEINMNLQKAIDDHLKRLYERYKSNTKVFTAAVVGHISLSTVFVISILVPFLFLQIDARETNSELERLSQGIAQQEQRAAALPPGHDRLSRKCSRGGGKHAQTFGEATFRPSKRKQPGVRRLPCRTASSRRWNPAVRLRTKTVGWNAASDSTWRRGLPSTRISWPVKLPPHSRGSTSRSSISGRRTFKPE